MQSTNERVKRTRWVRHRKYAIRVEVEGVLSADDPGVARYEPQVADLMREIHDRAEAGDVEWLKTVGDVYVLERSRSA